MGRTVAESAAAYRIRRAEKLKRWESALQYVANRNLPTLEEAEEMVRAAREALNPDFRA